MSDKEEQQFKVHVVPMVGTDEPLTEGGRPEGLPDGMAYVEQVGDGMVLHDPVSVGIVHAVAKQDCEVALGLNSDRIAHFKERAAIRGLSADQFVILILDVDDVYGGAMAECLMPGHDWQTYRDRGETPFARGLVNRDLVTEWLLIFDHTAYEELEEATKLSVVVVAYGVAIVREA